MSFKASVNPNFTENKSKGYINYGIKNDLPNIIIELVGNSNVTQACLNTKSFFLRGEGFIDESVNTVKVNQRQTIKKLLNVTCKEYSIFEGFAWKLYYNVQGGIAKIEVVPFETLRLGIPDEETGLVTNVKYKPNWNPQRGQRYKTETLCFDLFNPDPEFLQQQIDLASSNLEDYCQIFYYFEPRPGARTYPIPQYMGGDWINIDGEISKFHYTNLLSGFFSSAMVTLYGKTQGVNAQGTPNMIDAIEAIKGAIGSENAGNVAVLKAETKEQKPDVQQFATNGNSELFNTLQDQTTRNISIGTRVPSIIAGIETAGKLGQSQEILNAIDLFQNNIISPEQDSISEVFTEVFKYWNEPITSDFAIKNAKPFNSIPDQLLDVLTEDEKRDLIGYEPKPIEPTETVMAQYESYYISEADQYIAAKITPQMIAEKYNEYFQVVNMNANEYNRWTETAASKSTGTSRIPVLRNIELLNINKGDWNEKHYRWATQAIAYINRMRDVPEAAVIGKYGMSSKAIRMKNWGVKI